MADSRTPSILVLVLLLIVAAAIGGVWLWNSERPAPPDDPGVVGESAETAAGAVEGAVGDVGEPPEGSPSRAAVEPRSPGASVAPTDGESPEAVRGREAAFRVRGIVVDPQGRPIEGARVGVADQEIEDLPIAIGGLLELEELGLGSERTGADGAFDLPVPKAGKFRVFATHPARPRAVHQGRSDAGADVDGVRLTMRDGASIHGRVVGVPEGAVDAQHRLVVSTQRQKGTVEAAATTAMFDLGGLLQGMGVPVGGRLADVAEDGTFAIEGLDPDATYLVTAALVSAGASEDALLGQPLRRCTASVDVRAGARGVELVWRESLTLGVTVVDAATGAPIEELHVEAGFVETMTVFGMEVPIPATRALRQRSFPGGVVHIDELEVRDQPGARVAVQVGAVGYRQWSRDDVEVPAAGHVDLGTVRLEVAPVVAVRVFDRATGEPIRGARCELRTPESEDGEEGANGENRSISFSTNVSVDGESDGPEMDFGDGADSESGVSGDDGICRLTAQTPGERFVSVEADGYAPWTSDFLEVPVQGELSVAAPQTAGGSVRVLVLDPEGRPAPGEFVRRVDPVGDDATDRTDATGVVLFERLTPGEHGFRALDVEGDESETGMARIDIQGVFDERPVESVEVVDGERHELTIRLPRRADFFGSVSLDGQPLDAARIRLTPREAAGEGAGSAEQDMAAEFVLSMLGGVADPGDRTETDPLGEFVLRRVPVGDYRLVVTHDALAMSSTFDVRVAEGAPRADFALHTTVVRGHVFDSRGEPIARARVSAFVDGDEAAALASRLGEARDVLGSLFGGGSSGKGGSEVRSADDGSFELRGVRAGVPLRIHAQARLHQNGGTAVAALTEGESRDDVTVVLEAAGRVRIDARSIRGAVGAKLVEVGSAEGDASTPDRNGVLRSGRATIDGLRPGTWRVTLEGPGLDAVGVRTVEVRAGETARVVFDR